MGVVHAFDVLGDPVRRRILELLAAGEQSSGAVTEVIRSEFGISHLSDNVILLQFLRGESRIKRALTVLKTRASGHDPSILEFEITSNGIELGAQFADDQSFA